MTVILHAFWIIHIFICLTVKFCLLQKIFFLYEIQSYSTLQGVRNQYKKILALEYSRKESQDGKRACVAECTIASSSFLKEYLALKITSQCTQ